MGVLTVDRLPIALLGVCTGVYWLDGLLDALDALVGTRAGK